QAPVTMPSKGMPGVSMDALLEAMVGVAVAAGAVLLDYAQDAALPIDWKPDASPVTAADRASHRLILAALADLGAWPVLSEEGEIPDWAERRQWARYWLVDPLDGTREFIDGSGEFAVHIALIEQGRPLLGVVHQPARGLSWAGQPGAGAWY